MFASYSSDPEIMAAIKEGDPNVIYDAVDITGEVLGIHKEGEFKLSQGYVELTDVSLLHLAAVNAKAEVIVGRRFPFYKSC